MKKTYYKPELSEFYMGFEYEALDQNGKWKTSILDSVGHLSLIESLYFPKRYKDPMPNDLILDVRVKNLHHNDVISLPFSIGVDGRSYKSSCSWYTIKFYGGKCLIELVVKPKDPQTLFNGTIKNKSELIKVLDFLMTK